MAAVLREREWGERGGSHPRSRLSPWDGRRMWGLGFAQAGTQKRVMVKESQSREETGYTECVGHLGKQAQPQGMGLSVFIGVGHFIG